MRDRAKIQLVRAGKSAKRSVRDLISSAGLNLTLHNQSYEHSRANLIKSHNVDLVVDVGANIGQYAKSLRRNGYLGQIISFEPLPDAFAVLSRKFSRDRNWRGFNAACGESSGRLNMNVSMDSVCSSLSAPTQDFVQSLPSARSIGSTAVDVVTLDDTVSKFAEYASSMLLKIDVQGYERNVLTGATHILEISRLVEVELSLANTYEGALTVSEAIPFFTQAGFRILSIGRGFTDPHTGQLIDADFLFERC
jgi:FkbM family methyltransferase